jgi:hypothetical protein
MAMESRFSRRVLGEALEGAIKAARLAKAHRHVRVMMPSLASADPTVAYGPSSNTDI